MGGYSKQAVAIVLLIGALTLCILPISARALSDSMAAPAQINEPINDADLVAVPGNTRPEATAANDRGLVPDDFPLDHLLLQLRRSPQRERKLQQLLVELEDPGSPNYHHWLSAQEFGNRFGASPQDLNTITAWLLRRDGCAAAERGGARRGSGRPRGEQGEVTAGDHG